MPVKGLPRRGFYGVPFGQKGVSVTHARNARFTLVLACHHNSSVIRAKETGLACRTS